MAPRFDASSTCVSIEHTASTAGSLSDVSPPTVPGGGNGANDPTTNRRAPALMAASSRFLVPSMRRRFVDSMSRALRGPSFGSAVSW
jgi:hypothetical protein